MEIELIGVPAPHGGVNSHGWCSVLLTDDFNGVPRRRLLTGVNLIRPIGSALSTLPNQPVVKSAAGVTLGRVSWFDPNLKTPGSIVVPITTIEPKATFIPGSEQVRLTLDAGGLHLDPTSPTPSSIPNVPMSTGTATSLATWTLSDPTLLNVQIRAFRQTVGGGVQRLHEGSLAIFSDLAGDDVGGLGFVADVMPIEGGGSQVTAFLLTDLFSDASALGLIG